MNIGSPPLKVAGSAGIEDGEEDQNPRYGHGTVHGRAENKVVLLPPQPLALLDPETKNEADNAPAAIVGTGCRRNEVETAEEQGNVDLFEPLRLGEDVVLEDVDHRRQQSTEEEEPEQITVQSAICKEAARSNGTPDHAGVEVGAGKGTCETVVGLVGADVGDVVEGPF